MGRTCRRNVKASPLRNILEITSNRKKNSGKNKNATEYRTEICHEDDEVS
jgi:hypothetical protein